MTHSAARIPGVIFTACFALLAGSATLAQEKVANQEVAMAVYEERKEVMESLGGKVRTLRNFANGRGSISDAAAAARGIAEAAEQIPSLFPSGSGQEANPKSEASPLIWERWDDFNVAAIFFRDRANELATALEAGEDDGVEIAVMALAREGCGGCHHPFREHTH